VRLAGALLAAALGWGAAAGAAPLAATEVAPGVFVYRGADEDFTLENGGGIANLAFVVGKQSVAVIDSGGSLRQGRELLDAVRARTPLAVSHVIDTHLHTDHILGNGPSPTPKPWSGAAPPAKPSISRASPCGSPCLTALEEKQP
jgi:glyoxylase-like metal-dependent hydrolase (beta-lactamase superfamily II)